MASNFLLGLGSALSETGRMGFNYLAWKEAQEDRLMRLRAQGIIPETEVPVNRELVAGRQPSGRDLSGMTTMRTIEANNLRQPDRPTPGVVSQSVTNPRVLARSAALAPSTKKLPAHLQSQVRETQSTRTVPMGNGMVFAPELAHSVVMDQINRGRDFDDFRRRSALQLDQSRQLADYQAEIGIQAEHREFGRENIRAFNLGKRLGVLPDEELFDPNTNYTHIPGVQDAIDSRANRATQIRVAEIYAGARGAGSANAPATSFRDYVNRRLPEFTDPTSTMGTKEEGIEVPRSVGLIALEWLATHPGDEGAIAALKEWVSMDSLALDGPNGPAIRQRLGIVEGNNEQRGPSGWRSFFGGAPSGPPPDAVEEAGRLARELPSASESVILDILRRKLQNGEITDTTGILRVPSFDPTLER